MNAKPDAKGMIEERLPDSMYKVKLEDGTLIICTVSGKMRWKSIRVDIGDKVAVVLDKLGGKTTNRIVRRL